MKSKLKDKLATDYNGRYCALYEKVMEESISHIAKEKGLQFNANLELPELTRNITSFNDPIIKGIRYGEKVLLIEFQYNTTTSSGQTKYYDNFIKIIYEFCATHQNVRLVNGLDGAGWIARSADYSKVYNDCHYFINLNNVNLLRNIIIDFFNI